MKKLALFASFIFVVALIFTFSTTAIADVYEGATGTSGEDKCEHEFCRTDATTGEEKCLWNGIAGEFCSCCNAAGAH